MSKNVLLIGPACSGKTETAKALIKLGFTQLERNFYSIEKMRKSFGDGTFSGEMMAWAHFVQTIEFPVSNDNCLYEFSGTGRNVFNVSSAIKNAKKDGFKDWVIVYHLAPLKTLSERLKDHVYENKLPFNLGSPLDSINFVNQELEKTYKADHEWGFSPKLKFNTAETSPEEIAKEIIKFFER